MISVEPQQGLFRTFDVVVKPHTEMWRIRMSTGEQLSLLVIQWLAEEFGLEPNNFHEVYQFFKGKTVHSIISESLQHYILGLAYKFREFALDDYIGHDEVADALRSDILGSLFQRGLDAEQRKKLASNYTLNHIADYIAARFEDMKLVRVVDPFCGSGRLITSLIDNRAERGDLRLIRINDIMPEAVLIATARIYQRLNEYGMDTKLVGTIGDGFQVFSRGAIYGPSDEKYDLVVMNPPFTRTHRLDEKQRKNLQWLLYYYRDFVNGQAGLHIHSIFLADYLLKKNGHLGAVLPASTILSDYSRGVQEFFLKRYEEIEFALLQNSNALSEGSEIREILFFGRKGKGSSFVKFHRLRDDYSITHLRIKAEDLINEWNWYKFLNMKELVRLYRKILGTGLIRSADEMAFDIIRGIEMYGPNFFFFPNKDWKILADSPEELVIIDRKGNQLEIPKRFLVKTLRKPGLYSKYITPKVNEYALSIPPGDVEDWFKRYTQLNEDNARVSQRNFGDEWYSHIYHQLQIKNPYGNAFIIDKMGILTTSVGSHFLDTPTVCTKNFYLIKDANYEDAKLLSAWLNSSLFLTIFLTSRREISGSFGRLQISDYKRDPTFIDIKRIKNRTAIVKAFDELRSDALPPWRDRKALSVHINIDELFIDALGLDTDIVDQIYNALVNMFKELSMRDKRKK